MTGEVEENVVDSEDSPEAVTEEEEKETFQARIRKWQSCDELRRALRTTSSTVHYAARTNMEFDFEDVFVLEKRQVKNEDGDQCNQFRAVLKEQ